MVRVNIVIGRFQPFTKGHYECVRAAMRSKNLPTVICMIDVPESKVDTRHPFPSDMLVDLYSELFKNNTSIIDIIAVKNANIVSISEQLLSRGFVIASWTCGSDRISTYSRMSEKYKDLAGLASDFEMIEVSRTDEDISATKARNCLLNDDKQGFLSMIPAGVNEDLLYETLKSQIESVYSKTEELVRRVRYLEQYLL